MKPHFKAIGEVLKISLIFLVAFIASAIAIHWFSYLTMELIQYGLYVGAAMPPAIGLDIWIVHMVSMVAVPLIFVLPVLGASMVVAKWCLSLFSLWLETWITYTSTKNN